MEDVFLHLDSQRSFQKAILAYLMKQKDLEEADIKAALQLSEEEKIEQGLLIKEACVKRCLGKEYELATSEDNTKLRVGDSVKIKSFSSVSNAKVLEQGVDSLTIETEACLMEGDVLDVEVCQYMMLDPMIELASRIDDGCPGSHLMAILAGEKSPKKSGLGRINPALVTTIPQELNAQQRAFALDCLARPSVYCMQGPPGTGKTAVLSVVANTFACAGKEVLVIANTHQAVNNALNKIASANAGLSIIKIGESIKSEGLSDIITCAETYNGYLHIRSNVNYLQTTGDVVGMTLHAAIVNLGLRKSGFLPKVVLVDEAGQMPLVYASLIGTFGCGSIIFMGDDLQMPPIYHPQLRANPLSRSIFEYLCSKYPSVRHTLQVTYRMNNVITEYISKAFYEKQGLKLVSSDYSKDRRLTLKGFSPTPIEYVIVSSSQTLDLSSLPQSFDCNLAEADKAVTLARLAIDGGLGKDNIAIVTPYRKQVKAIRSIWNARYGNTLMPLVGTVECLQGQDVDMIIISMVLDGSTIGMGEQLSFVMEPHRLNVMVSRAKNKVMFLLSSEMKEIFDAI